MSRAQAQALSLIGRGTLARLVSTGLALFGGLAFAALSVRLLTTGDYGALAFGVAAATLVAGISHLGIAPAAAQSISASQVRGDPAGVSNVARALVSSVAMTSILGIAVLGPVLYAGLAGLGPRFVLIMGSGLGLLLFGRTAVQAAGAIAQGLGRVVLMEVPPVALSLLQPIGIATLLALGVVSVEAIAIMLGSAGLVTVAISAVLVRRLLDADRDVFHFTLRGALRLASAAGPYALVGIAVQVVGQFDVLVLGITHTAAAVGAYEPALRLTDRLLLLVTGLATGSFFPAASRLFAKGERGPFIEVFVRVSKLTYIFTMPAVIFLATVPGRVMELVYGPNFVTAADIVLILVIGYVLNLAAGINVQALMATGARGPLTWVFLAVLIAMVVTALVLIPPLGAYGAAVATAISYTVMNATAGYSLYRVTGAHPFRKDMILAVVTSAVPLGAAFLLFPIVGPIGPLAVFLCVLLIWLVWVIALFATSVLRFADVAAFIPFSTSEAT